MDVNIPSSGFTVKPGKVGSTAFLGDPLSHDLVKSLTAVRPAITELWAAWHRSAGALDLLQDLDQLQRLHVINRTSQDLAPIAQLHNLRILSVDSTTTFAVDATNWPLLEELSVAWGRGLRGLEAAQNLKTLRVSYWKDRDLTLLKLVPQLQELWLTMGSVYSLYGIAACTSLAKLSLAYLTKLDDFEPIRTLKNLEWLSIDACKRFTNVKPLAALPQLKSLSLDNLGRIDSLTQLASCKRLKNVFFADRR